MVRPTAPEDIQDISRFPEGYRIGDYRLEGCLGQGAQSCVYLASKGRSKKRFALKVFSPKSQGSLPRKRFLKEGAILSRMEHKGLVRFHDLGEADGLLFLLMDYVEGGTFQEILDSGVWTRKQAAHFLLQVLKPLGYLHEKGIIHRDLKPSNILVSREGMAILSDFGLAKEYRAKGMTLTMGNQIVGTPRYMSFEQATGQRLDPRSDLASFCILLFEALTGRNPFFNRKLGYNIGNLLSCDPAFNWSEKLRFHADLRSILLMGMHKDRVKRPADCASLEASLRPWLDQEMRQAH